MSVITALEPGFIPRTVVLPRSQDFARLRARGLRYVERLGHRQWTDYNVHDPGITILELFCYGITDLGLRAAYPMRDLLAVPSPGGATMPEGDFHLAHEILVTRPVSFADLRRLLIDLPGVRNAWVERHRNVRYGLDVPHETLTADPAAAETIELSGLFDVYLEYDDLVLAPSARLTKADVRAAALGRLHVNRSLCQDLVDVHDLVGEDVAVCADIELRPDADTEAVHAEILYQLHHHVSPSVPFHSLEEMFARGKTVDEIYDGPLLDHGFIDEDELAALRRKCEIRASDVFQVIMSVDGVVAVKSLKLVKLTDPVQIEDWILPLSAERFRIAVFSPGGSKLTFYKRGLPYLANRKAVEALFDQKKSADIEAKLKVRPARLTVPAGEWRNAGAFEPLQNELPGTYCVGRIHVPARDPVRQAQSRQLRAYLMFFEQMVANALAQLAHVGELFTWRDVELRTYFTQQVEGIDGFADLDYAQEQGHGTFLAGLQAIVETPARSEERRLRFLEHLAARYGEEFDEYSALMRTFLRIALGKLPAWAPGTAYAAGARVKDHGAQYECLQGHTSAAGAPPRTRPDRWRHVARLVAHKRTFLGDYPAASAGRGTGFDWRHPEVPANISGYQRRLYRLLDIEPVTRRQLAGHRFEIKDVGTATPAWLFVMKNATGVEIFRSVECESRAAIEALLDLALRLGGDAANYDPIAGVHMLVQRCAEDETPDEIGRTLAPAALNEVIAYCANYAGSEGFHLIEHILLRRRTAADPFLPVQFEAEDECCPPVRDPYSFRVSIVLPSWSARFRDMKFRHLVEDTLRREAPAHIYPRICWVNHAQMQDLEVALEDWQSRLASATPPDGAYAGALQRLVNRLYHLTNVYPLAQLHDCEEVRGDTPQVTLGSTTLGTL